MSLEQHQVDALKSAYALLKEHFDASLIVVTTTIEDTKEATKVYWSGGYITSIGLSHYASHVLKTLRDIEHDPSNEEN